MIITLLLMGVCIAVFAMIYLDHNPDKLSSAIHYGAFYYPRIEYQHEYWRLITHSFVHTDIVHIFMNMYCTYYLGGFLEQYVFTKPMYIFIVIASAVCSGLCSYIVFKHDYRRQNTVVLGFSGVFYGYLGSIVALGLLLGGSYFSLLQSYMMCIIINLGFTLMNPRISKEGHVGGLIGGFVSTALIILFLKLL